MTLGMYAMASGGVDGGFGGFAQFRHCQPRSFQTSSVWLCPSLVDLTGARPLYPSVEKDQLQAEMLKMLCEASPLLSSPRLALDWKIGMRRDGLGGFSPPCKWSLGLECSSIERIERMDF